MQNRLTALACFLFLMYLAGASSAEIPPECSMLNATAMFCDYPFYNLTVNPEPVNYFYGSDYQEFNLANKHTTGKTVCVAYVFDEPLLEKRAEIYKTKELWMPCAGYVNLSHQINGVSGFDVLDEPPPTCDVGEINDLNKKYLNVSFTNGTFLYGCINSTKNLGDGSYDAYWWKWAQDANQCLQNITGYYDITSNFSHSNETGTYMGKSYVDAHVYSACKYVDAGESVSYRVQYFADQASNKWDLWIYGQTQYCFRTHTCNFANNTDPTFNNSNFTYYTEFNITNATSISILLINTSQYNFTQGVQGLEFVYVNDTDSEKIPWYIPKNAVNDSWFRVHLNFSKWIPPDTGAGGWFAEGRKDMTVRLFFDNTSAYMNSSTFYAGGISNFSDDFNIDGLNTSKWKDLTSVGVITVAGGFFGGNNGALIGSVVNDSFIAPLELCALWNVSKSDTTYHMSPCITDAASGVAGNQFELGFGNNAYADDWGLRGYNSSNEWVSNVVGRPAPTALDWACVILNLTNASGLTGNVFTTSINDTLDIVWADPQVPAWPTFAVILGTQSSGNNMTADEILVRYRPYPDPILTSWAGFILTGAPPPPPPADDNLTITLYLPPDNNITHTKEINYTYDVNMSNETTARVELWLNDTLLANDSISANTTLTHNFITTYGHHEYYVFAYKNANHSVNDTSATWTFDVQFNITLTQDAPADNNYTMNKTISINYSANLSALENTTVQLYFDDVAIRNDTITSNTTFTQDVNATFGNHTWYIFAHLTGTGNETFNSTTVNRSLEVFFNLTANDPVNGMNISGAEVVFRYNISTLYQINCSVVVDGDFRDNRTLSTSQDVNVSITFAEGSYSYHISCTANDNPAYQHNTTSRTFHTYVPDFDSILNLTTFPQNVFASPQAMFFNINGLLNVLYFSSNNSQDYINIHRINDSVITQSFYELLNRTKSFYVAMREINQTTLLTFATNDTSMHFLNITSTLDISTADTSYNVSTNALFDPYSYANTKHFKEPNISAASFHIFWLPTTTNTTLMRKFVNNETLEEIDGTSHNRTFAWQTIANTSNLTDWLYVAPEACDASTDKLSLYKYDGSSTKLLTLDETCYSEADLAKLTVYFEAFNASHIYVMIANSTNASIIHHIQLNRTFFSDEDVSNPSHIFFINEDTLVFFNQNATDTYAHSCYFTTTPNCTAIASADYGVAVPYQRGTMTTTKREANNDYVVRGAIISGSQVQFTYTQYLYDTKFITYDEVDEYRQTFTLKIYTNTSSTILDTGIWGYVISSSVLGLGTTKAYSLGFNGTQRLYIIGVNLNFSTDFYSLDSTAGAYYIFQVVNQYSIPLPNIQISAHRFSNLKQAWVIVEQCITDYSGYCTLFLQPSTLYQITVVGTGYLPITFDFTPSAITSLQIRISQEGASIPPLSDFEHVWNDVSYTITPSLSYQPSHFNITFLISSNASLDYYGMNIYYNTSTLVYSANITDHPSGGTLRYEANDTGKYLVQYWFKHQDHEEYSPLARIYFLQQNRTGLAQARQTLIEEEPISGWGYYFMAVIFTMLVVGYVSRYTIEGAGIAGLITLWIFTMLYPDAVIVCLVGGGACITPLRATFLTTIALAVGYVLNRIL